MCLSHGGCNGARCAGSYSLQALFNVTYMMDQKQGSNYHKRLLEFLKEVQGKDLAVAGGLTDVKGDRSKRPSQQSDPDMYLRVVERKDDGIIIRGAKIHQSSSVVADYYLAAGPTVILREEERDYAVSCAVASDADNLIYILEGSTADMKRIQGDLDIDLGNARYGMHSTSLMIFDNVFVPWERVFMCGEYQFVPDILMNFSRHMRPSCSNCKAAVAELMAGGSAVAAEYNGLDWRKDPHLRDLIMSIIEHAALGRGCAMGAVATAEVAPAGNLLPDILMVNAAKLYASDLIFNSARCAMDVTGGIVATALSEKDLRNPPTQGYMEKYLKGRDDVSVEDRLRIVRFVEYVTGLAGTIMPTTMHSGGSPEVQRMSIRMASNIEDLEERAKKLAGIKKT